jgi:hypothetical protein
MRSTVWKGLLRLLGGTNPTKRMATILVALVLLGLTLLLGSSSVSDGLELFRQFGHIGFPA